MAEENKPEKNIVVLGPRLYKRDRVYFESRGYKVIKAKEATTIQINRRLKEI